MYKRQEIENGGSYLPKGRYLLDRSSVEFLVRERRSYAYGDMDRQRVLRSVFAGLLRYAQSCTCLLYTSYFFITGVCMTERSNKKKYPLCAAALALAVPVSYTHL